ncbi:MAG: EAL domain-containing protein [Campylobacterota bacterium]|nr:EAL domain-containing protein [Campylobacterota bacterium]
MSGVVDVIKTIEESSYFDAWGAVLLSEVILEEWHSIIEGGASDELYNRLGARLYFEKVPYVIVSEYVDEFLRYCKIDHNAHEIKNRIARAYLDNKLKDDSDLIDKELNKKLSISLESKKALINAHLKWMQNFIVSIIDRPMIFELDSTKCFVGRWILEEGAENLPPKIDELHKNLHSMASSAIRMYKREDYAYFLLLYLDILMSSYQIRDLIMNLYFSKRISSIYQDPLLRCGNYFQLRHDIEHQDTRRTLLILNIKEFSKINLLYGHEIGDKVIKEVYESLSEDKAKIRVYRIYGDEFAVLLPRENEERVAKSLKSSLEERAFRVREDLISLSFYGSICTTSDDALEKCEYGLMVSRSKYGEVVNVDIISDDILKIYADNITIAQELRLAFMDNRIIPFFQPIYELESGKITKYEVLMRVEDIHSNILTPDQFLDVLQEMFIYPEVTKLIIKKSFEVFAKSDLEFSINLSFADIINLDTEAFIIAILKQYPDVASRCTFELLETEAIHNHQEVSEFFHLLHSYGVKIALDDFGVGYSNYETIFKFDIDYIKIDGSLTESILTNSRSMVLMESIITVSKKLNAKLIVEFVSSKEIFDVISEMDVDYVQGYFIGKPSATLLP